MERVGGVGGAIDLRDAAELFLRRVLGTGTVGGARGWYESNEAGKVGWNADWGSSEASVGVGVALAYW